MYRKGSFGRNKDPYELAARFAGKCRKCNETIHKGEAIYYWPLTKAAYHKACAAKDYRKCQEAIIDEDMFAGEDRTQIPPIYGY